MESTNNEIKIKISSIHLARNSERHIELIAIIKKGTIPYFYWLKTNDITPFEEKYLLKCKPLNTMYSPSSSIIDIVRNGAIDMPIEIYNFISNLDICKKIKKLPESKKYNYLISLSEAKNLNTLINSYTKRKVITKE